MRNYQAALIDAIRNQLATWSALGEAAVQRDELHRFLHSIKGTAGTIGLRKLSHAAGEALASIGESGERDTPSTGPNPCAVENVHALLHSLVRLAEHEITSPEGTRRAHGVDHDAASAGNDSRVGACRLLAFIDDPALRDTLRIGLEQRGYKLQFADRPASALAAYGRYRPDGMLIELGLDPTGGFDMLLELREQAMNDCIQTTVISFADTRANRIKSYRLGADDYVPLPVDIAELAARLERQTLRKVQFDRLRQRADQGGT